MGYKSYLRSAAAASRRREREAMRRQRELERHRKQLAKMQELERAEFEVQEYENHVEVITSIHRDCGPQWDWQAIADEPPPPEPRREWFSEKERAARTLLDEYSPGRVDRLFGRESAKREALAAALTEAIAADEQEYLSKRVEYEEKFAEWQGLQRLATRACLQTCVDALNWRA